MDIHPQHRLLEWLLRYLRPSGDGNDLLKHVGVNLETH
jgi:hypothetical protein